MNKDINDYTKLIEQYELLQNDTTLLLEFIAFENDIDIILKKIVEVVQMRFENNKCSILLLNQETNQLFTACAPSLPQFYNDAISGVVIGDKIGSCGSAAYNKKRVIVENIDTHENWKDYIDLAKKANLHSCWSEPILSDNNNVLGTFALYSNIPKKPSKFELKMISNFSHILAVAIQKSQKDQEQKALEFRLKEKSEDLQIFKQVVDNVNSGIVITSSNKKQQSIIYVNKAFEKNTGYSKKEAIGKNCNFLQKNDRKQPAIQVIKKAILNEEPCQVEIKNYRKNGELFYNLLNIAPIFSSNHEVKYFVGIQNDITHHKQQERMVIEQSKMAALGEMIANIAHQWRQPLSAITTSASGIMLQKEYNNLTDDFLNNSLQSIENHAQYLSKTIDTFRNFITEEKVYKEVILQDRIDKSLKIIESSLKNSHIELINDIDYNSPIKITLVTGELTQVIINLLNNSKDAILEKQIKNGWIKLGLQANNETALITIEDNGGGIPQEILPKIFQPYFTTKHKAQGTGLGLNMSYKIITESLNGDLYVENTNNGAKFFIALPLK